MTPFKFAMLCLYARFLSWLDPTREYPVALTLLDGSYIQVAAYKNGRTVRVDKTPDTVPQDWKKYLN